MLTLTIDRVKHVTQRCPIVTLTLTTTDETIDPAMFVVQRMLLSGLVEALKEGVAEEGEESSSSSSSGEYDAALTDLALLSIANLADFMAYDDSEGVFGLPFRTHEIQLIFSSESEMTLTLDKLVDDITESLRAQKLYLTDIARPDIVTFDDAIVFEEA